MSRAVYEEDVIKLLDRGWKLGVYPVASNIHALPPAQPEIISCPECKYYDTDTEQCNNDKGLRFIDFGDPECMWCSWAERLEE